MEEILDQYLFLYSSSALILSIPQSICAFQASHRRNLLGFLLGLVSIFVLFSIDFTMLPAQPANSQYLVQNQDDWQAFQFILLFAVSVVSVFSLSISAFLFHEVFSKLLRDRTIRNSNWRMIIVVLLLVPVVSLHTLFLAVAIYFPSEIFPFNLYSRIAYSMYMLPISFDALLLIGMGVVSVVNSLMCTAVIAIGMYTFFSKQPGIITG